MSINIGTEEAPILVNVALSGGMVDAYVRATDRATFDAAALVAGLTYEVMQTVVDEEGNETTEGTGEIRTARGVEIHHIGPVVITPAVLDEEGNVTTPAVMDTRHHVNFRMGEPAVSRTDEDGTLLWQRWAAQWTAAGADDTNRNNAEEGKVLMGVSLIDPDTISSKAQTVL
jgi:hypothetical protein